MAEAPAAETVAGSNDNMTLQQTTQNTREGEDMYVDIALIFIIDQALVCTQMWTYRPG